MPSKSPEQAKLMRAIAHGWKPSRMKSPPSRAVAQEFVEADRKYSGGFAENRYWTGGLAAMNEVNSGVPETLNWQEGGEVWTPWGGGQELTPEEAHFLSLNIEGSGVFSAGLKRIQDRTRERLFPTTPTIATPTAYPGPRVAGPRGGSRRGGRGGGRRDGGREPNGDEGRPPGGGPGGPSTAPPRIIPSAPPIAAGPLPLDKDSAYRDQLRAHKSRISSILGTGNAEGGHVNYYEEGGEVRPGHGEGANPYPPNSARYRLWERKHHVDLPPPTIAEADPEESFGWLERLLGVDKARTRSEKELEELEEAHGGRVGYQAGGLAMAAPAGGVPPWIEPTGSGPGYMDSPGYMDEPPPGYQFGGMAAKLGPVMRQMQQYRGVPPQRGGIQRGAPSGGGTRGGLAAMMQQARQQRGSRYDPTQDPNLRGPMASRIGGTRGGPLQIPGQVQAGGGMYTDPTHPAYSPPGSGGSFDMSGNYTAPTGGGRPGKPGRGIIPLANEEAGGGVPGGPRVPPNMRGYLQRQRMMNRPPANVGGGVNRVGMQDQQGGMARALQRGTGRPPMSRRSAFPGSRR